MPSSRSATAARRSVSPSTPRSPTRPAWNFARQMPPATSYLALAAQLMAGLDGIRRKIDPTAAGFGPIDANIFAWSDEQRASDQEAAQGRWMRRCAHWKRTMNFCWQGDVFSEELIRQWVDYKRKSEYYAGAQPPAPLRSQPVF